MSISVMTAIWKTCLFQGNTLTVLLAMADFASDDGGDIFPGIELLAGKCRTSIRTAQNALRELEVSGAVEQITSARGGRGRATEYRIDLERVQDLQGLHRAELPDCEHCRAKRRNAQKRAQHRAERVQKAAAKGADPARKGADSDQKGADPRERNIDSNHQEPSMTHYTNAREGAGESGNVASLGREDLEQWPAFRSAIAATWPNGFPDENEIACRAEFGRQSRKHPAEMLIECARLHGVVLTKRQRDRPKSAGKILFKQPSSWLQSGDWQGYQVKAREQQEQEKKITLGLLNVARAVGPELFEFFRHQLGLSDAVLAALDGIEIEDGPPTIVVVTNGVARMMLERHQFALQRKLGEDLTIRQVRGIRPQSSTTPN